MSAPSVAEAKSYLAASGLTSWSDGEIGACLAAEGAAQAKVCRVPGTSDEWPADLREALLRRVARNLAMRKLPLGIATSEIEATRVGADIEVRRLEGPYRRWAVA